MNELIYALEATGMWWKIGRGQARSDEPLMACIITEPRIDGSVIVAAEGDNLAECIRLALKECQEWQDREQHRR